MASKSVAHSPIRLAVVGGQRGRTLTRPLSRHLSDRFELVAICDRDPVSLREWQDAEPGVRAYARYDDVLADDVIDAVLIATPFPQHASQIIAALQAGKHVLTEVLAATDVDECWAVVEAVQRTGLTFMMAENCCFSYRNLLVQNLAESGAFGQLTYLEGSYLHDCRPLFATQNGALTWRGDLHAAKASVYYPTHAIAPVDRWLKTANGPEDRLVSVSAATSSTPSIRRYFAETFGEEHAGSADDYWRQGDSSTAVIQSASGAVINIRVDSSSPRPDGPTTCFALQGSRGGFLGSRHAREEDMVWTEDLSAEPQWIPVSRLSETYEHSLWTKWKAAASDAGHGGSDFMVMERFANSVHGDAELAVDVYDAVTWSAVAALSAQSIAHGGAPTPMPDFRGSCRPESL